MFTIAFSSTIRTKAWVPDNNDPESYLNLTLHNSLFSNVDVHVYIAKRTESRPEKERCQGLTEIDEPDMGRWFVVAPDVREARGRGGRAEKEFIHPSLPKDRRMEYGVRVIRERGAVERRRDYLNRK
jgi:hypothetical protein